MIFEEILNSNIETIQEAVRELFLEAKRSQTHPNDLLLVAEHAHYDEYLSGFLIGPNFIGHASHDDYTLFDWYRKSHLVKKEDWLSKISGNQKLMNEEKNTIQIEKLIYLKYWESGYLMKQLYLLTELASGKNFNWFFELPSVSDRGGWQTLIREKIRDKIRISCPKFYKLLKNIYKTQLRNAIAHSEYVIWDAERIIQYLNYSADPKHYSAIDRISYDDWGNIFISTLLLQSEILRGISNEIKMKRDEVGVGASLEIRRTNADGTFSVGHVRPIVGRSGWSFD